MRYSIIEDCSPFYIRFTHASIENVITKSLEYLKDIPFTKGFTHHRYPLHQANDILNRTIISKDLSINKSRVSMFVTQPGVYYRAHKDGLDHRYSINYTVKILDSECKTSWYDDGDLTEYSIDNLPRNIVTRECVGFNKTKHTPIKSMTAIQGECILFNTDIFHDFDNTTSKNERMVLTLRDVNPGAVYFEDVRKKLFGT